MRLKFFLFSLSFAAAIVMFAARDQAAAACAAYSASVATIAPCVGPPNTAVTVNVRRAIEPKSVSFLTGVSNGMALGGIAPELRKC